jgi:predicted RNA binding protein YcfA (HicA-like mRNA interferase family)
MSKQEKLVSRLRSKPKDFTWSELMSLMKALRFTMEKSSGSGRKFIHEDSEAVLFIHEPHPSRVLKSYQVRDVIALLEREGFAK